MTYQLKKSKPYINKDTVTTWMEGLQYENDRVFIVPFGDQICRLALLRVLKSNVITVRIITVPLSVLNQKKI